MRELELVEYSFQAGDDPAASTSSIRLNNRRVLLRHSTVGLREKRVKLLLTVIFIICLWRSTGVWYGYPSSFDESGGEGTLAMRVLLYSLVPLIVLYVVMDLKSVAVAALRMPVLIFLTIAFSVLSVLVSIDPAGSVRGLLAAGLITFGILFYRLKFGTLKTMQTLAAFFVILAFANVVYTILFPQYAVMRGSYAGMVKGLHYHKNGLGQTTAIGMVFILSFWKMGLDLRYRSIIGILAVIFSVALILLARSSTAVVLLIIGCSGVFVLSRIQSMRAPLARLGIFVLMLFGLAILSTAYMFVAEAIAAAFDKDLTLSGRSGIWEQLIPLIAEKPLLGHGFAMFRDPAIIASYVNATFTVRSVHNSYLELALNIGLVGALCFVSFLLLRLTRKFIEVVIDPNLQRAQAVEITVIMLVMMGAYTEAGRFMTPTDAWAILVAMLPFSAVAKRKTANID